MEISSTQLFSYLRKYGSHSMAYTTLEPEMEYFELKGIGYLAYISFRHWFWAWQERKIVLADPVCDPKDFELIAKAFTQKFPNVIFVAISKRFSQTLESLGLQVNQFGIDTEIPLANFDLSGKKRAKLRQWKNKCLREGVSVKEQFIDDCSNMSEIKALSKDWLKKKGGGEYSFLVRPLSSHNEEGVRYFWAFKDDELIAFAVFDPIYENEKIIAYYHNIDRMNEKAPHGTSVFIILSAIETFEKEGVDFVSLGMSPLCLQRGMANELKSYNKFTRKSFWYAFEKLNFLYPFQGNALHKNKFNGDKKPVYIASTNGTGLKEVFTMMKAIGMF